jgi:hypothetical protein
VCDAENVGLHVSAKSDTKMKHFRC